MDLKTFRHAEFLRREAHLKNAKKQQLVLSKEESHSLHIVYVMTNTGVCGGTKIILEHANRLAMMNQKITLVSHFKKPTWFPMNKGVDYIQVPFEQELALGIPPCDVIVATYWREIYECIAREIAPVVYFEQGGDYLFAWENIRPRQKDYIYKQFQLAPYIYTVSKGASEQISKIFGRESTVINNAIDKNMFYNDPMDKLKEKQGFTVITIGSENVEFKRVKDIKHAISLLRKSGYDINLIWVSPDEPSAPMGSVHINPEQNQIGHLLRKSDVLVSATLFESFSLPALEAMASGCAVITTKNKGVTEYAVDGVNCVMVEMNNPKDIAKKILQLYNDAQMRNKLIAEGLETASRYTWSTITSQIIDYYREISRFTPKIS